MVFKVRASAENFFKLNFFSDLLEKTNVSLLVALNWEWMTFEKVIESISERLTTFRLFLLKMNFMRKRKLDSFLFWGENNTELCKKYQSILLR